jgi:hypothetical protein
LRKSLGSFWDWLPEGAVYHDPNAYLAAEENAARAQAESPTIRNTAVAD